MSNVTISPPAPVELAATTLVGATNVVTSNNTYEDVTGFSLTVPATTRPYYVYLVIPYLQQNTIARISAARITDNSGNELATAFGTSPVSSGGYTATCAYRSAATTVSTVYKVQMANVSGAGTCYFSMAATNPARLYAVSA